MKSRPLIRYRDAILRTYFLAAVCLWLPVASPAQAKDQILDPSCLRLAYDPRSGENVEKFKTFFGVLYSRAGICAQSVPMLSTRKEFQLLAGEIDGDWVRVEGFEEHSKGETISLPQPVFYMAAEFLWFKKGSFSGSPSDLSGRRVAYPSGFKWIEWNLKKQSATGMPLPSEDRILTLLQRGRITLYATGSMNTAAIIRKAETAGIQLQHAEWQKIPFFHLLHRKHAALVPRLNAALTEMIQTGEAAILLQNVPGIHIPVLKSP
jgi:hypothetical protein